MINAAEPSLRLDELPAVTVPPALNNGRSAASFSIEVSRRGCSSVSKIVTLPLRSRSSIGMISSANRPSSIAAIARACEW